MGLVFGMDEAGYGPNLGPLVITVTAWEVPGSPTKIDLWNALSAAVAKTGRETKARGPHLRRRLERDLYALPWNRASGGICFNFINLVPSECERLP